MIGKAYKRWRHTRGYGVHSPFAYQMVTEVINGRRGYAYYGEEALENKLKGYDRNLRRFALKVMRLASRLDIGSTFISNNIDKNFFENALKAANSRMALTSAEELADNSRLIITDGNDIEFEKLEKLLERPGRVLLLMNVPKGWNERLFDSLEEGLMFHGKKNSLLINRPMMHKVSYSINL